ncbi:MAG TPA: WXG100 family type VII secretion target [Anaerolineales bacterium]|nr:WXG100 family type VII secretion target [Anaerolineales bacterium]
MSEKVRMNYDTMREMTKQFQAARQQLEETLKAVTKLGNDMDGGALQGQAGKTFHNAINGPLTKALKKLAAKMGELAGDVDGARARLQDGVKTAKTRFQN